HGRARRRRLPDAGRLAGARARHGFHRRARALRRPRARERDLLAARVQRGGAVGAPLSPGHRGRQEARRGREGQGAQDHPSGAEGVPRHRRAHRGRRAHHRRRPRDPDGRHAQDRRRGRARVRRDLAAGPSLEHGGPPIWPPQPPNARGAPPEPWHPSMTEEIMKTLEGQDEWDAVLGVNTTGVYALTQTVLPSMLERGAGTVVTVASLAALRPGGLAGVAYGVAKAGARAMMQALHAELRNRGIRATTIIPAEVDTPILDKRPLVPGEKERSTMMQADDVARAILLCCTMHQRTVLEEIVMSPTFQRDTSKDVAAGYAAGAPPGAK